MVDQLRSPKDRFAELVRQAGFVSVAALAKRADLRPEVISRALGLKGDRLLRLEQIDRIARVLNSELILVVRLFLRDEDADRQVCERFASEIEQLQKTLAEVRGSVTMAGADVGTQRKLVADLTAELGKLHDERSTLRDELQRVRAYRDALQSELATERRRLATQEQESRSLREQLVMAQGRLEAVKDEAAKEIAQLTHQIEEMRGLIGSERVKSLRDMALSGAFGLAVGVLLGRASPASRVGEEFEGPDDGPADTSGQDGD